MRKRFWNAEVPRAEWPDELAEDGKCSSVRAESGLTDRMSDSERTGLPSQAMEKVQLHCWAAVALTLYKKDDDVCVTLVNGRFNIGGDDMEDLDLLAQISIGARA